MIWYGNSGCIIPDRNIRVASQSWCRHCRLGKSEAKIEFKAVMVLPENYGNFPYGNYVSNAPVGKV